MPRTDSFEPNRLPNARAGRRGRVGVRDFLGGRIQLLGIRTRVASRRGRSLVVSLRNATLRAQLAEQVRAANIELGTRRANAALRALGWDVGRNGDVDGKRNA